MKKVKIGQWIEGSLGDDILTGTAGRDTFVMRADGGHDTITNFSTSQPDYILLDSQTGVWDGMLGTHWGFLYDGFEAINSQGTLVATLHATDANSDGIMDSQFVMASGSTITLLGVAPTELVGTSLFGG